MNGSYNIVAFSAICAWIPIIVALFALIPPRRAVIAAFVVGYLFLPDLNWHFPTIPDVNKVTLTEVGVILGSLLLDGGRLFAVRPRLIDLAWLILCLTPIVSSLTNGLTIMDGLAMSMTVVTKWGLAYWVGRAYFTDWEAARELAVGIILGGLAYVPLCWWEIRMSPQLHSQIYGWLFISFRRDSAIFGFRPNVFLADGLTVTMFMGVTAVLAYWAWMTESPKKLLGMPMGAIAMALVVTTVFCKALGGVTLMMAGIGVLTMLRFPRTKVPVLLLLLAAPTYMIVRSSGEWSGQKMVEYAGMISEERGRSLAFRLQNEDPLAARALEQPWFGWAGWGRSHVFDSEGHDTTINDGLWLIILGEHGIVGLGSLVVMVLGSAYMLWRNVPTRYWTDPACAAPVALAVITILYMIDSLFNATFNPVASLAVGAVASMSFVAKKTFAAKPAGRGFEVRPTPLVSSITDIPYVHTPVRS
jgi:hypothetical protein